MPFSQGDAEMAAKINRAVTINGEKHWIRANTEQEYADKLLKLANSKTKEEKMHPFDQYAMNWFTVYSKPNIETVTATTYKRQLTRYLLPAFNGMTVEEITTDAIQQLFNSMDTTKATKEKVKIVLNQILDAAVEDNILDKNPMKSSRLKITGKESKTTAPYTVEQMRYLVQHISDIQQYQDRAYLVLQALHPLRLEEVLGLKWGDIDWNNGILHVNRAVTHPDRNQPEVKRPKTASSIRTIGLSPLAKQFLIPGPDDEFVFGGKAPLSYQQVKRMCKRIGLDAKFEDKITPIRFRTTVLTDIYNQTKDIKLTQEAAGHTTANMTMKHYVKSREEVSKGSIAIENLYTA